MDEAKVHRFGELEEAEVMCQVDGEIRTGDVIVVDENQQVGIAFVWPLEVVCGRGELRCANIPVAELEKGGTLIFTSSQVQDARAIARVLGFYAGGD